mmetsp:Transcript_5481/g.13355  ORF Transcript_5481/g.13355 Transcript_5481/m.13355 type:complete len:380 (+) Transcript_5481:221-1360(+)|eukprot:CAMPEP_0114512940 /NCGR_PEP_ID=MMETSP0109-20121206/15269_1 /TAXON_ID=29199 /ORGANISM="Chlorarachnion reptans, Strain CCCM449" /LENGTH=379 /DNA_ID=CAMNT_0001692709 /DNA_START=199 /DNA_END=1338 /DNA_ORIENTATION=+
MKKFFGKTPADYVASCGRCLDVIFDEKSPDDKVARSFSKLEKNLKDMTIILYGDGEKPVDPNKITKLIREFRQSNLVTRLVMNIHELGFEVPKSLSKILCFWLHDKSTYNDAIGYFTVNPQLIPHLIRHFEKEEVSLPSANIVKEALIHPQLLKPALEEKGGALVFKVLDYVALKDVAFASEAYGMLDAIINCRLSKDQNISADMQKEHLKLVAKWLEKNKTAFWKKVHTFMEPNGAHLMMEQMLKLVYQILKTHRNYYVMIDYINDPNNLTRIMKLLRVPNKKIQVMAFNVFKIFVANPKKEPAIVEILLPNREKIQNFLKSIGDDDELDGKFEDDLEVLKEQLKELKALDKKPKEDNKSSEQPKSEPTKNESVEGQK